MFAGTCLKERCCRILEEKGGSIADNTRKALLDEIAVDGLQDPLHHISEIWRDPLVPCLIVISSEVVGGTPDETVWQVSKAISLVNLTLRLWDDIVDKTLYVGFVPTLQGKFGYEVSLLVSGLVCGKAFSILNGMDLPKKSRKKVTDLVWNYCRTMAEAQTMNLEFRKRKDIKPEEKLKFLEMEGVNLETSMKVGATLGGGSEDEVDRLGKYGRILGTVLELVNDFKVSVNMTLELSEKIKRGALPYTILWARERSNKIRDYLDVPFANAVKAQEMKRIVDAILETGALENILFLIRRLAEKAKREISMLRGEKSHSLLTFFVETQHRILVEEIGLLLG